MPLRIAFKQPLVASAALPLRVLFAGLLLVVLLAACSGMGPGASPAASVDRAERLVKQGNHSAAADMYARLAEANPGPDGTRFGFAAVREWIAAGRPDEAQRVFGTLGTPASPDLVFEKSLLSIELLSARGQSAEAWRQVSTLAEPRAASEAKQLYALRQRVALAANRPVDAVRAGIALERAATTDAERAAARRDLLAQLRQSIERGQRIDPQASNEPLIRGWLELGVLSATAARSPLGASADIDRWRSRYPGHPGSTIAAAEILGGGSNGNGAAPLPALAGTHIALLLPITGRQGGVGTVIRDGFQTALTLLPEGQRPTLRVYDTAAGGVAGAMSAAQTDGAGFIVGPLTREEITEAIAVNAQRTPMLLLNFLPFEQPAPAYVYQFALSPEDEARQIARRALSLGQRRAIVLAPSGDWGSRVVAAFREELTAGGGSVIVQESYDLQRSEFTSAITRALRIDESRARHKRVEEIVGSRLNFEPRRRSDVQMIFAAGEPIAIRQIRPQLRFFYAGDVPTYMTSDGFDPDPSANRDIDGMLFPDTPWMLQETGPVAETRAATQAGWSNRGPRIPRYFAFGYDAGQLALALQRPKPSAAGNWPLAGVTGLLAPNEQRRFRRELDWAQIRGGKPELAVGSPATPLGE